MIATSGAVTEISSDAGLLTISNELRQSGANTYAGSASVETGTLALVGGSHQSPITVSSGAGLGFTVGFPLPAFH